MNNLKWITLLNSGKMVRQMTKFIRNRQDNNNWAMVSMLGLGAVLGAVISRSPNMTKSIQKMINIPQGKGHKGQFNLANATEFAKEIMPNMQKNQK